MPKRREVWVVVGVSRATGVGRADGTFIDEVYVTESEARAEEMLDRYMASPGVHYANIFHRSVN